MTCKTCYVMWLAWRGARYVRVLLSPAAERGGAGKVVAVHPPHSALRVPALDAPPPAAAAAAGHRAQSALAIQGQGSSSSRRGGRGADAHVAGLHQQVHDAALVEDLLGAGASCPSTSPSSARFSRSACSCCSAWTSLPKTRPAT